MLLTGPVTRAAVIPLGPSPATAGSMSVSSAAALRNVVQRVSRPLPRLVSAAAVPQAAPAEEVAAQQIPDASFAGFQGFMELNDDNDTHFGVHLRVPASVAQGLAALAPGERYLTAKIQLQANDDGHFLATAQSLEFSESPPQAPAQPSYSSGYSQVTAPGQWEALSLEAKWQHVFANPGDFFDARAVKTGRQPDFKSRNSRAALWLDTRGTPDWVPAQITAVFGEAAVPAALPGTIMTKQQKFEALLADPGAFYDNRADKRNPRAPDFKHKTDSQLVIWLDDTDQATQATIHNIFGPAQPAAQPMGATPPFGQGQGFYQPPSAYDNMYAAPQYGQPQQQQQQNVYANPPPAAPQYETTQPSTPEASPTVAAPQAFNAAGPSGQSHRDDNKWQQYFENPGNYFDNRFDKRNPRSPDFKHKGAGGEGLWLDGAPEWVKQQLGQS